MADCQRAKAIFFPYLSDSFDGPNVFCFSFVMHFQMQDVCREISSLYVCLEAAKYVGPAIAKGAGT